LWSVLDVSSVEIVNCFVGISFIFCSRFVSIHLIAKRLSPLRIPFCSRVAPLPIQICMVSAKLDRSGCDWIGDNHFAIGCTTLAWYSVTQPFFLLYRLHRLVVCGVSNPSWYKTFSPPVSKDPPLKPYILHRFSGVPNSSPIQPFPLLLVWILLWYHSQRAMVGRHWERCYTGVPEEGPY